jgi:hypothetical protein
MNATGLCVGEDVTGGADGGGDGGFVGGSIGIELGSFEGLIELACDGTVLGESDSHGASPSPKYVLDPSIFDRDEAPFTTIARSNVATNEEASKPQHEVISSAETSNTYSTSEGIHSLMFVSSWSSCRCASPLLPPRTTVPIEQGRHCSTTSPEHTSLSIHLEVDALVVWNGWLIEKGVVLAGHSVLGRRDGIIDGCEV